MREGNEKEEKEEFNGFWRKGSKCMGMCVCRRMM
jgi:hypothetical protein